MSEIQILANRKTNRHLMDLTNQKQQQKIVAQIAILKEFSKLAAMLKAMNAYYSFHLLRLEKSNHLEPRSNSIKKQNNSAYVWPNDSLP